MALRETQNKQREPDRRKGEKMMRKRTTQMSAAIRPEKKEPQARSLDLHPMGVSEDLHREILRRINNRFYENRDICSLRRGGPGLTELAGLIPLMRHLDAKAVRQYVHKLERVRWVLQGCMRCEGKLFAIMHDLVQPTDAEKALSYMILMLEREAFLRESGYDRDFLGEVRAIARTEEARLRVNAPLVCSNENPK